VSGSKLTLAMWLGCSLAACSPERFESLGSVLPDQPVPGPSRDAGVTPVIVDASAADAGTMMKQTAGQSGAAAQGGAGGSAAAAGGGGITPMPPALTGAFGAMPFSVQAAYLCGEAEEDGTATLYLFDHKIICAEVSGFAWLSQLPTTVNVIEIVFPMSSVLDTPVTGSRVSYMRGGTYSFAKTPASTSTLVLTRAALQDSVEGNLTATFGSLGNVSGFFHADFCETARTL
jgi:hypothetical protein